MDKHIDFRRMLEFSFKLIQANMGLYITPEEAWKDDGQALAVKLFKHLEAFKTLRGGTTVDYQVIPCGYIDHSTMAVLLRSALENYLTFKYIFVNKDTSESLFRHKTWKLSGLIDRSKVYATQENTLAILAAERSQIDLLLQEIEQDNHFSILHRDHRKEIKKGKWKPKNGWSSLGGASMHQIFFNDIYNHLSGYAHSSYISSLQMRCAQSIADQEKLADALIIIACQLLAHFITSYTQVFPECAQAQPNSDIADTIHVWYVTAKDTQKRYDPGLENPYSKQGYLGIND